MPAGRRDRLVTVQQATEGSGTSDYPVTTWSELGPVWMEKKDLAGAERFTADQLAASVESEFEMAYWASMDPDLVDVPKKRRLSYAGRFHDIVRASKRPRSEGQAIRLFTVTTSQENQP